MYSLDSSIWFPGDEKLETRGDRDIRGSYAVRVDYILVSLTSDREEP